MNANSKIEKRIAGRKLAEELIQLYSQGSIEFRKGFANACREYANKMLGLPEDGLSAMDDEQAIEFESKEIAFGVYKGTKFGEVDISYLTWVADQNMQLQAYLRSDRGRGRIEVEE